MAKKFKIQFAILFNLCLLSCFSQETRPYGYLYVNIVDTNTVTRNREQLVNNDKNLNNTFKDFNVFSYRYAFPKVKSAYLKKFAAIECYCNVEELAMYLKENYSNYFSEIEYVQNIDHPDYTPSDPLWYQTRPDGTPELWHLKKIQADQAWDITKGSSDITIAIIDKGFDISHPDLVNKIEP